MLLRNANSGGFEVYDIANNNITGAAFLGNVGLDWQVMGFGNFSSFGENDMILRNANNGGVEVYDIRNNQIIGANFMGTVGLDWQFAASPRFTHPGRPISCCATSTPAHSRFTILRSTLFSEP